MDSGYLWGGTLVGLLLIGLLGLALALKQSSLREALTPYVGERPARWFVYGVWFVYGYGLLHAFTQAYMPSLQTIGVDAPPSGVAFLYGALGQSVLWFVSATLRVLEIGALLVVATLLFRHLRTPGPVGRDDG